MSYLKKSEPHQVSLNEEGANEGEGLEGRGEGGGGRGGGKVTEGTKMTRGGGEGGGRGRGWRAGENEERGAERRRRGGRRWFERCKDETGAGVTQGERWRFGNIGGKAYKRSERALCGGGKQGSL